MYIYVITNSSSGKQYVGQTIKTIKKRFQRHCWASEYKKNMPICLAIKKYGKDNFSIKELCDCNSQKELDEMEIYWAKTLKTFSPNGYNLRAGSGRGSVSEETKRKIGLAHLGKKASAETRKKLSESHKGFRHSEESKKKMSEYWKGRKPPEHVRLAAIEKCAKEYVLISPSGEIMHVKNMRLHCMKFNLSPSKMSNVVTSKRTHHKGWRNWQPPTER